MRIIKRFFMLKICKVNDIPINKGKEFNVNGIKIAVFNVNGKFYAIEALCRHQDGPLADGILKGEVIECPWHFWHYNVRTGELLDFLKNVKLTTFNVYVKGDELYIEL
jgi:nitrite reductase (NADH) small subunit